MGSIYFKFIFWIIAFLASFFYSYWAFKIHLVKKEDVDNLRKEKNYAWFIHQFWFNFIGSITGWIILWLTIPNIFLGFCDQNTVSLEFKEIVLLFIALIGITGHLPMALYGIVNSFKKIIEKLLGS